MKNIVILESPQDIHRHVHGLWRSEPIRTSHADGGFIHDIVEQFANLPRLFLGLLFRRMPNDNRAGLQRGCSPQNTVP